MSNNSNTVHLHFLTTGSYYFPTHEGTLSKNERNITEDWDLTDTFAKRVRFEKKNPSTFKNHSFRTLITPLISG